ncbi:uncharacterized protein LOC135814462 isoform X2 [Sycon ciliatum]|uniref:uncharacterized protein LOC135814462 isoform X2 n=1 Tax=Sycon ciliatum TaxID=27933 RepID=UPI0031F67B63
MSNTKDFPGLGRGEHLHGPWWKFKSEAGKFQGKVYYWNSVTKQRQWTRPSALACRTSAPCHTQVQAVAKSPKTTRSKRPPPSTVAVPTAALTSTHEERLASVPASPSRASPVRNAAGAASPVRSAGGATGRWPVSASSPPSVPTCQSPVSQRSPSSPGVSTVTDAARARHISTVANALAAISSQASPRAGTSKRTHAAPQRLAKVKAEKHRARQRMTVPTANVQLLASSAGAKPKANSGKHMHATLVQDAVSSASASNRGSDGVVDDSTRFLTSVSEGHAAHHDTAKVSPGSRSSRNTAIPSPVLLSPASSQHTTQLPTSSPLTLPTTAPPHRTPDPPCNEARDEASESMFKNSPAPGSVLSCDLTAKGSERTAATDSSPSRKSRRERRGVGVGVGVGVHSSLKPYSRPPSSAVSTSSTLSVSPGSSAGTSSTTNDKHTATAAAAVRPSAAVAHEMRQPATQTESSRLGTSVLSRKTNPSTQSHAGKIKSVLKAKTDRPCSPRTGNVLASAAEPPTPDKLSRPGMPPVGELTRRSIRPVTASPATAADPARTVAGSRGGVSGDDASFLANYTIPSRPPGHAMSTDTLQPVNSPSTAPAMRNTARPVPMDIQSATSYSQPYVSAVRDPVSVSSVVSASSTTSQETVPVMEMDLARQQQLQQQAPVAMMDTCSNEENMEVGEVPVNNTAPGQGVVLVVDTNVLIHSLQMAKTLLEGRQLPEHRFKFVIPNTVIAELDSLKKKQSTAVAAQNAIKFVQAESKAHRIHMQKIEEVDSTVDSRFLRNNDDHIVLCAHYFHKNRDPRVNVLLWTNDINMFNKAESFSVPHVSDAEIKAFISEHDGKKVTPSIAAVPVPIKKQQDPAPRKTDTREDCQASIILTSSCTHALVENILSMIVVEDMKDGWGETVWQDVVKIKPRMAAGFAQWDALALLDMMEKYWHLFDKWSRHQIDAAKSLRGLLHNIQYGPATADQCKQYLNTVSSIMKPFKPMDIRYTISRLGVEHFEALPKFGWNIETYLVQLFLEILKCIEAYRTTSSLFHSRVNLTSAMIICKGFA